MILARLFFLNRVIAIVWHCAHCRCRPKTDHNFFVYMCIIFILGHKNICDMTFKSTILNSIKYLNVALFAYFCYFCITFFLFFNVLSSYLYITMLIGICLQYDQTNIDLHSQMALTLLMYAILKWTLRVTLLFLYINMLSKIKFKKLNLIKIKENKRALFLLRNFLYIRFTFIILHVWAVLL